MRGNCRICKERIEKAALAVEGVTYATWTVSNGELELAFDPERTSLEEISLAIARIGHETNLHQVEESVMSQMPACCRPIK